MGVAEGRRSPGPKRDRLSNVIALALVLVAGVSVQDAPGVESRAVLVRGLVVDHDGGAIAGVQVLGGSPCVRPMRDWELVPFESRPPERLRDVSRTVTGDDGRFELGVCRAPGQDRAKATRSVTSRVA